MAKKFYYPPAPGNGKGTFSDNLVGMQITEGSPQMTLGNFSISDSSESKRNISFVKCHTTYHGKHFVTSPGKSIISNANWRTL